MENIDVYVKCYYHCSVDRAYDDRNRPVSVTGCKMIWAYLLSDTHFNDLLQRKINATENSTQSSGQTLSELYIDVFWYRQEEKLSVNFDFYTKEGGQQLFNNAFEIPFADMNRSVDTAKKGQGLREFLLQETKRVDKSVSLFLGIMFISIVTSLFLGIYGFVLQHHELFPYAVILFLPAAGYQLLLGLCIRLYLPKETQYKTKLNLDSPNQRSDE